MMNSSHRWGLSGLVAVLAALPVTASAQSPRASLGGITSTAGGLFAWHHDLVNVEQVQETGRGAYVAVLDSGFVPHWRDYFPEARVATHLGAGFWQPLTFKVKSDACGAEVEVGKLQRSNWIGSRGSSHGTLVASTILGYFYDNAFDAAAGFPLPAQVVRGIAPDVTVIPVQVLADYRVPAMPACGLAGGNIGFGTPSMIAAGLDYVTGLAIAGYRPMVVNMSLGGNSLDPVMKAALDHAIANGVIVVASAGNEGVAGMGYPGAYPPVISAGSVGWRGQWAEPGSPGALPSYRMWWLQYPGTPLLPGSGDVADATDINDVYVSDFSSRALPGQELDVLAPGSWVRGPWPGVPGYNHQPWWSAGLGLFRAVPILASFFTASGTSMAAPHVSSIAALMLQKNRALAQAQVQAILRATAKAMPASGTRLVVDFNAQDALAPVVYSWDTACGGNICDAVGAGLVQADAAVAATP